MARVKGRHTRPELVVRRALHAAGFRYRLHASDLPGKPDILLPQFKLAAFVNGCFWHGHSCKRGRRPGTNDEFWNRKLDRNIARDKEAYRELQEQGWAVEIVWQCSLQEDVEKLAAKLRMLRAKRMAQADGQR